ncbi:MAG: C40 family peptidase [Ferruginibacter sp.]
MSHKYPVLYVACILLTASSCSSTKKAGSSPNAPENTAVRPSSAKTFTKPLPVSREEFVSYAKTLLGTPYKYGSANPANGLDCSGFVYNVFTHFNVKCPRTSKEYTNEGTELLLKNALPGDIILFTGSDHKSGIVGHMGIVTENNRELKFIHSATSNSRGVIISTYAGYYKDHFVKLIRVLE